MDKERLQKALDSLVYLPHLKEKALHTAVSPVGKDAGGKGRVWDRGDLFRRLQTYTAVSWFCKPDVISPTECARRGWLNTAPDILTCEFCRAKVSCPIPPQLLPEEARETAARYAKQLAEAHDAACPWRTTSCAASLLQFPPLTQEAALEDFRKRMTSLQQLLCLPPIAAEAYECIAAGISQQALDLLLRRGPIAGRQQQGQQQISSGEEVRAALGGGVATWNADAYEVRLRLLALCGWDLKLVSAAAAAAAAAAGSNSSSSDRTSGNLSGQAGGSHAGPECSALTCTLCGAKAGLWTFFPSCRPQVQPLPARRAAGTSKAVPTGGHGGLGMGTTIAGGTLSAPGPSEGVEAPAAAAGPFGSPPQQPLFGPPSQGAKASGSRPFHNIAGGSVVLASPPDSAIETGAAAAVAVGSGPSGVGLGPAPGPFGAGAAALGSVPIFGIAALHGAAPAGEAAKRKQPDAEADVGEESAGVVAGKPVEKRSRAGDAEGGNGNGGGSSCAGNAASSPSPPMQYCSTEALRRYCTMETLPLDPLALHRAFCPWVCRGQGAPEGQPARCGWKWCLQQLVPGVDDSNSVLGSSQGAGEAGKQWDPAMLLRAVLQKVDVHK